MTCTFYRPETTNLKEFDNIIGKMEFDLEKLIRDDMDEISVYYYAYDLSLAAKPLARNPKMVFWGLDDPEVMPSDARRDFFHKPTFIATAFLMQAVLQYPELIGEGEMVWEHEKECVDAIREILPKAMLASTANCFNGNAYYDMNEQFEVLKLFLHAHTMDFIRKYPDMCPEFNSLFTEVIESHRELVKTGRTFGAWGEDYKEKMEEVIALADLSL